MPGKYRIASLINSLSKKSGVKGTRRLFVPFFYVDNIAAIAWFIEHKRLTSTAENFIDEVYNYITKLADNIKITRYLPGTKQGFDGI